MITIGTGHKRILLWSQMHGDESTATLSRRVRDIVERRAEALAAAQTEPAEGDTILTGALDESGPHA